jgi:hypothetical protein
MVTFALSLKNEISSETFSIPWRKPLLLSGNNQALWQKKNIQKVPWNGRR